MTAAAPPTSPAGARGYPIRHAYPPIEEETSRAPARSDGPSPAADEANGPGPLVPNRRRRGITDTFRLTGTHRPAPPDDRLLGVWAWATGLGVIGLAVALRGLAAITAGTGPSWYEPALASLGLGGVGLTVAALLSARRARLPWIMLGLATVPFVANLALTIGAL